MRDPIFGARAKLALSLGAAVAFSAGSAHATTVEEMGENGSELMARGGAWVARASDPLAVFYNPAGLAGQATKVTVQGNINILSQCFTRTKALNDTTSDGVTPGKAYPQVCNGGAPFPDPQIAFTYRLTPRLGLGFGVVGPSAAGNASWPEKVNGQPAPQRYLLLSASTLLLTPTLGVGWEPVDRFRIGLGLIWGIAAVDFANYSWAANVDKFPGGLAGNDVKGEVKANDMFIPGFTTGVIWSPTDQIDVAGWYKYISAINAKGDVTTTTGTGAKQKSGDTSQSDCGAGKNYDGVCGSGKVTVNVPIPMEAKIGVRFHQPRAGVEMAHVRDPMSQDIYDVEADLTWAHDSQFQNVSITLPPGIPVPGVAGSFLPTDASVPHNFKDVYGVHLGGDVNVIPDRLALRAGAYFETAAQDAQYQNIDFAGQQRIGFAGGATYRFHFGEGSKALEVSVGLGHTFIATSTDNGNNPANSGVKGLAGTPCNSNTAANAAAPPPTGNTCASGSQVNRTEWPVNLGTITNAFTQINLGVSYRF